MTAADRLIARGTKGTTPSSTHRSADASCQARRSAGVRRLSRSLRSRGKSSPRTSRACWEPLEGAEGAGAQFFDPAFRGSPILYQDTPEFEKYVQADVRRMADVVKKIGKVE